MIKHNFKQLVRKISASVAQAPHLRVVLGAHRAPSLAAWFIYKLTAEG